MAFLESMAPRLVDVVAAATLLDAAELDELAAFGLIESILDELIRAHATDGRDGVASGFLRTPQLPNVFGLPQVDVFGDSLEFCKSDIVVPLIRIQAEGKSR
jgi:hypothetical protein